MGVYTGTEFRFGLEIDGLYAGRFMEVSGGGASQRTHGVQGEQYGFGAAP